MKNHQSFILDTLLMMNRWGHKEDCVSTVGYQVVRNDEDNKTTPTTFPFIKYSAGTQIMGKTKYSQKVSFYNIFRDKATGVHAQQQQKIYHNL